MFPGGRGQCEDGRVVRENIVGRSTDIRRRPTCGQVLRYGGQGVGVAIMSEYLIGRIRLYRGQGCGERLLRLIRRRKGAVRPDSAICRAQSTGGPGF